MNSLELSETERPVLAIEIEELTADHAAGARRAHQHRDDRAADVVRKPKAASRRKTGTRRERDHRDAGRHGDAHAEHAMHGRAPAAHVVVVHARQVVVHERISVHDLYRGGDRARVVGSARRPIRREKEQSAQAFSAAEETVANRVADRRLDVVD